MYEAIPLFAKDKAGIKALHVVAEWGVLLALVGALRWRRRPGTRT